MFILPKKSKKTIEINNLKTLIKHCQKAEAAKFNMTQRYGKQFVELLELGNMPDFDCDVKKVKQWCDVLSSKNTKISTNIAHGQKEKPVVFEISYEESGLNKKHNISLGVFASKDYKNYNDYVLASKDMLKSDAYLTKQDKVIQIHDFLETFKWIIAEAKKGYSIQRYKGLGEMNPEQLWETTMDPEARTLVQMKEEDRAEAEKTFEDLMGDNVSPRKAFIEERALYAVNIDI